MCAEQTQGSSNYEAIKRAVAYRKAGADIIFVEALGSTDMQWSESIEGPLFNMTEFGITPETRKNGQIGL